MSDHTWNNKRHGTAFRKTFHYARFDRCTLFYDLVEQRNIRDS